MEAKNPLITRQWRSAVSISLIYALVASVWIYASDVALVRLSDYPSALTSLQTYKGWLFVAVTALLLYGLICHFLARELERQALAQRFDYLSKYANDIILLMDSQGRLLEANDRAVAAYGYAREELLRLNIRRCVPLRPGAGHRRNGSGDPRRWADI